MISGTIELLTTLDFGKFSDSMSNIADEPAPPSTSPEVSRTERLMSIDALRGFDMFWIAGGDEIAKALGKLWGTPSSQKFVDQFEHVGWEGFRFYDLIFPLFLFTVGVVLPFSLRKYTSGGQAKAPALWRLSRRVLVLFFLGLVYSNFLQFHFDTQRYPGVLQRIAVCYGIAALIYLFTGVRTQVVLLVAILLGYWAILAFVPSPESHKAGDYSIEHNLSGYIDRHVLPGKIYKSYYGYGDNEGILSTVPAIATALLGVLAGQWLLTDRSGARKGFGLALAGAASVGIGTLWGQVFPVIKILWTSSYVLIAGGYSLILLSMFYMIIDVLKFRKWAFFFVVIGVNAITIYMANKIINFDRLAEFFFGGLARYAGSAGSLVLSVGSVALGWLFLLHLYRHKIFLRV
jgi:predicted acyltransferase